MIVERKPVRAGHYKLSKPSRQDVWQLAAMVVCAVHAIVMFSIFNEMPSLLVRYPVSGIFGAVAYSLLFGLLECIIATLVFTVINTLIPSGWGGGFVIRGAGLVSVAMVIGLAAVGTVIREWPILLTCILALLGIDYFVVRYEKFRNAALDLIDRMTILAVVFLTLDFIAVLIVLWRNLV